MPWKCVVPTSASRFNTPLEGTKNGIDAGLPKLEDNMSINRRGTCDTRISTDQIKLNFSHGITNMG